MELSASTRVASRNWFFKRVKEKQIMRLWGKGDEMEKKEERRKKRRREGAGVL